MNSKNLRRVFEGLYGTEDNVGPFPMNFGVSVAYAMLVFCVGQLKTCVSLTHQGWNMCLNPWVERTEDFGYFWMLFFVVVVSTPSVKYLLVGLIAGYLAYLLIRHLPYMNPTKFALRLGWYCLLTWISFAYYASYLFDDPSILFVVTVFLAPLLVYIVRQLLAFQKSCLLNNPPKSLSDLLYFARHSEDSAEVLRRLAANQWPCTCVYESLFLIEKLQHYELACLSMLKIYYDRRYFALSWPQKFDLQRVFYDIHQRLTQFLNEKTNKQIEEGMSELEIYELETDTYTKTLNFVLALATPTGLPPTSIEKNFSKIISSLYKTLASYSNFLKKFPNNSDLYSRFAQFRSVFLRQELRTAPAFRSRTLSAEAFRFLVYGFPPLLGKIAYMNYSAQCFLGSSVLGKHFYRLFPYASRADASEFLSNLILTGGKLTSSLPYVLLMSQNGHWFLAKLEFQVCWSNFLPFFLISVLKQEDQNLLLMDQGFSKGYSAEGALELTTISAKLPISLVKHAELEPFISIVDQIPVGFVYFTCPLTKLYLLISFTRVDFLDKFCIEYPESQQKYTLQYKKCEKTLNWMGRKRSGVNLALRRSYRQIRSFNRRGLRENLEQVEMQKDFEVDEFFDGLLKTQVSLLKLSGFLTVFLFSLVSVAISMTSGSLLESMTEHMNIDQLGKIRYLTVSIVHDARALNLLKAGLEFTNSQENYRESLMESAGNLDELLQMFGESVTIGLFKESQYFRSTSLQVTKMYNGEVVSQQSLLIDALKQLVASADAIALAPLAEISQNNSDFYYIYRNGPGELLLTLNSTVFNCLEDTVEYTNFLFDAYKYINLALVIPGLLGLLILTPSFLILTRFNKLFWESVNKVNICSVNELVNALVDQLGIEFNEVNCKKVPLIEGKSFLPRICIGISLILGGTIGSYCVGTYSFASQTLEIMNTKPKIDFWYGMHRMMPAYLHFWCQESFLEGTSNSYSTLLQQNAYFPSPSYRFEAILEDYRYLQGKIAYDVAHTFRQRWTLLPEMMFGNPCDVLSDDSCVQNSFRKGIKPAAAQFTHEASGLTGQTTTWANIANLESEIQAFEKVLIEATEMIDELTANDVNWLVEVNTCLVIGSLACSILLAFIAFKQVFGSLVERLRANLKGAYILDPHIATDFVNELKKITNKA